MVGVFIVGEPLEFICIVNKLMSHHTTKKKGELIW